MCLSLVDMAFLVEIPIETMPEYLAVKKLF